jgi:hypothetical protein
LTVHAARRPPGVLLLAAFFAAVAASDLWQVAQFMVDRNAELPVLVAVHGVLGLVGAATAAAVWRRSSSAPWLAAAWGVLTAALLVALPSVLGLPPEARSGLWVSAAAVLVVAGLAAWYLRRRTAA